MLGPITLRLAPRKAFIFSNTSFLKLSNNHLPSAYCSKKRASPALRELVMYPDDSSPNGQGL